MGIPMALLTLLSGCWLHQKLIAQSVERARPDAWNNLVVG
jgi:hypothetical protein